MKVGFAYLYCIAGNFAGEKFGEFGKSSVIRQTNLVLTIDNLLADLLIRQTFFRQMLEKSQFAKLSPRQTFPLYGMHVWLLQAVLATYSILYD